MADLKSLIAKHFQPIFKAYDKDGNQTLQKDQLRALLADNLGVSQNAITQEQLDWHFGRIDADNDGKITFSEYFSHFFGQRAKVSRSQKNDGDNQDDLIDKAQFRRLMQDTFRPLNIPVTQDMVDWNFAQIDTDNSGRIAFQQYLAFIKKYN